MPGVYMPVNPTMLLAGKIGYAFSRLLDGSHIVIGRDMRLSSPALARAIPGGYAATGTPLPVSGWSAHPSCIIP
jgi:phosphomannomutase